MTFLHQTCRLANLHALIHDHPNIRELLPKFTKVFDKLGVEDTRGTRLQEVFSWTAPVEVKRSANGRKRTSLQSDEYAALLSFLSRELDPDHADIVNRWRAANGFQHPTLVNEVIPCDEVKMNGVSYSSKKLHVRDSEIVYDTGGSKSPPPAGQIQTIFQHRRLQADGNEALDTFLIVRPYKELREEDVQYDLYRTYKISGGWLCYQEHESDLVVLRPGNILCHAACTSLPSFGMIQQHCIRILPTNASTVCQISINGPRLFLISKLILFSCEGIQALRASQNSPKRSRTSWTNHDPHSELGT